MTTVCNEGEALPAALDLSPQGVAAYWDAVEPRLSRALALMERFETWTHEQDPAVGRGLEGFAAELEGASSLQPIGDDEDNLLYVMAYIKSRQALRLLHWLDDRHPGYAARLTYVASPDMDAQGVMRVFIDRLQVVRRMSLASRIFHPTRIRLVLKALEDIHEEDND